MLLLVQYAKMLRLLSLPILGRILAVLFAIAGSLRLGAGIWAFRVANALERPEYSVLRTLSNGVELRRYEPYLIAETEVDMSDGKRSAGAKGFPIVAGYIFGKNRPRTKMQMTAPVRMSKSGGDLLKLRVQK